MARETALTERVLASVTSVSRVAVWIGGSALLLTAIMISIDVVFRKLFGINLGGADELTGYVFAAATSWTLATTLRQKSNIRIDLLYTFAPRGVRRMLDVLSFLAFGIFLLMLTLGAYQVFAESYRLGTASVTPLQTRMALPQGLWFAGYVLAVVMWLAIGLRVIAGGHQVTEEFLGAKSIQEEAAEELESLRLDPQDISSADEGPYGDLKQ